VKELSPYASAQVPLFTWGFLKKSMATTHIDSRESVLLWTGFYERVWKHKRDADH